MARAYSTLEISPGASSEAVERAYRDLISIWNPRNHPDGSRLRRKAEEKTAEINSAYEIVLGSPSGSRETYPPVGKPFSAPSAGSLSHPWPQTSSTSKKQLNRRERPRFSSRGLPGRIAMVTMSVFGWVGVCIIVLMGIAVTQTSVSGSAFLACSACLLVVLLVSPARRRLPGTGSTSGLAGYGLFVAGFFLIGFLLYAFSLPDTDPLAKSGVQQSAPPAGIHPTVSPTLVSSRSPTPTAVLPVASGSAQSTNRIVFPYPPTSWCTEVVRPGEPIRYSHRVVGEIGNAGDVPVMGARAFMPIPEAAKPSEYYFTSSSHVLLPGETSPFYVQYLTEASIDCSKSPSP
ncbi:MAG: J domain-containing protein, partial [Chloroflexota bacterium]